MWSISLCYMYLHFTKLNDLKLFNIPLSYIEYFSHKELDCGEKTYLILGFFFNTDIKYHGYLK